MRCMMRLDARVVVKSDFLCSSLVVSPMIMNIRARMMEAPAPVANEYAAHVVMHIAERITVTLGWPPARLVSFDMII